MNVKHENITTVEEMGSFGLSYEHMQSKRTGAVQFAEAQRQRAQAKLKVPVTTIPSVGEAKKK